MLDALLDILPPGSRFLRDEVEFTNFAFFKRPVTLPVEIARGARSEALSRPAPGRRRSRSSGR